MLYCTFQQYFELQITISNERWMYLRPDCFCCMPTTIIMIGKIVWLEKNAGQFSQKERKNISTKIFLSDEDVWTTKLLCISFRRGRLNYQTTLHFFQTRTSELPIKNFGRFILNLIIITGFLAVLEMTKSLRHSFKFLPLGQAGRGSFCSVWTGRDLSLRFWQKKHRTFQQYFELVMLISKEFNSVIFNMAPNLL